MLILFLKPKGFLLFDLDFHIPYYVLKKSRDLVQDSRQKSDAMPEPLRESLALPFLSTPGTESAPMGNLYCLYDAQISAVVTGIDDSVWTAYGFVDTYFGSKESVNGYDELKGILKSGKSRPDPLTAGLLDNDTPALTPREYFFTALKVRINEVRREWHAIIDKLESDINKYVHSAEFYLQ